MNPDIILLYRACDCDDYQQFRSIAAWLGCGRIYTHKRYPGETRVISVFGNRYYLQIDDVGTIRIYGEEDEIVQ